MALGFGRKKTADDAATSAVSPPVNAAPVEAAPVPAHAPSSPLGGDLDAFDLDAFAPPLADAPASGVATTPLQDARDTTGSAFDFPGASETQVTVSQPTVSGAAQVGDSAVDTPDFDKLYEIEQANAVRSVHTSAPAPFVPPSATIQEPATPFYETQVPEQTPVAQPKKKFPLVPLLGALAILGAGSGVAYMMKGGEPEAEPVAPTGPRMQGNRPSSPVSSVPQTAPARQAPTTKQAPPLEIVRVKPVPVQAATAQKSLVVTAGSAVRPGIAPASDQLTQLKTLWNQGANAKHRGDLAAARRYWEQGLKLQPGNAGFKGSIAKLGK